jgi:hypothetical protein
LRAEKFTAEHLEKLVWAALIDVAACAEAPKHADKLSSKAEEQAQKAADKAKPMAEDASKQVLESYHEVLLSMRRGCRPRGLVEERAADGPSKSGLGKLLECALLTSDRPAVRSAAFAPMQLGISELSDAMPLLQVEDTAEDVGSKAEGTADDASKKLQGKARCALHLALLVQADTLLALHDFRVAESSWLQVCAEQLVEARHRQRCIACHLG